MVKYLEHKVRDVSFEQLLFKSALQNHARAAIVQIQRTAHRNDVCFVFRTSEHAT